MHAIAACLLVYALAVTGCEASLLLSARLQRVGGTGMCAQVLPFCVAVTFFVIVVFIIQTGNKNATWKPALSEPTLLWVSAVVGVGMGLLCLAFLMPFLRKRVIAWEAENNR